MIRSWADPETQRLYDRERSRIALRKLKMLNAAARIDDLFVPPGNRLEKLKGDRAGQWRRDTHMKSRSSITTKPARASKADRLPPVHPGEVLLEEFLKPLGISQYRLAKDISVPPRRVNEIVLRKRSISADTALRLGRYFGTSEQFWLNLQSDYDLDVERDRLGERLEAEVVEFRPTSRKS